MRRPTWRLVTYLRPWLIGGVGTASVRCRRCRQPCKFLGPRIEIPPKRDAAGWERLRDRVEQFHAAAVDRRFRESVRRRHALQQRIRGLEGRPQSPGRDGLLKQLRAELAAGA